VRGASDQWEDARAAYRRRPTDGRLAAPPATEAAAYSRARVSTAAADAAFASVNFSMWASRAVPLHEAAL